MKKKIKEIGVVLILIVSIVMVIASIYCKINFSEQTFDTIIYHLSTGKGNANTDVVGIAFKVCIIPILILILFIYMPLTNLGKKKYLLEIKIRKRKVM